MRALLLLMNASSVGGTKFPSFGMHGVHECFAKPVPCRPMMPMALARQLRQHCHCQSLCAASRAPGSWKTVPSAVASRDLSRATGAFALHMDPDCLYDIFYLQNGYPCACVALSSDTRRVKFACVNDALALLYDVDDFMCRAYKKHRKHLNVKLDDKAARAAYGA